MNLFHRAKYIVSVFGLGFEGCFDYCLNEIQEDFQSPHDCLLSHRLKYRRWFQQTLYAHPKILDLKRSQATEIRNLKLFSKKIVHTEGKWEERKNMFEKFIVVRRDNGFHSFPPEIRERRWIIFVQKKFSQFLVGYIP